MKIAQHMSDPDDGTINLRDVLKWTIIETYADMQRSMPLWAAQGWRFEKQQLLWSAARREGTLELSQSQAMEFLEAEAQTLVDRYSPHPPVASFAADNWAAGNQNVARINDRCSEFEALHMHSATLQEEQERELAPEVEQERQLERPGPAEAAVHHLHQDVTHFATTGELRISSSAFLPAFEALRSASVAKLSDVSEFSDDILVTKDFANTVDTRGVGYISDDYQQPVQWILTTTTPKQSNLVQKLIIISSFEAQELLPVVKERKKVTLHIYAPRASRSYQSLDTLDLFTIGKAFDAQTIPRRLIMQLNLFAGQLYLNSFDDYKELCSFLNLTTGSASNDLEVAADGFVLSNLDASRFKTSPVKFLRTLITKIRRNYDSIEKTDMGKILDGEFLTEEYFKER